jgi:hypothetical protein
MIEPIPETNAAPALRESTESEIGAFKRIGLQLAGFGWAPLSRLANQRRRSNDAELG